MAYVQHIGSVSKDVLEALVAGLELEFGNGAGRALAQRFLEAEEVDFLWDARVEERWLGRFEATQETDFDLDRIAILARFDGRWVAATLIIDGDGMPHGMVARRAFARRASALKAYLAAH